METTRVYWGDKGGYIGIMENNMETTIVYWYIGPKMLGSLASCIRKAPMVYSANAASWILSLSAYLSHKLNSLTGVTWGLYRNL